VSHFQSPRDPENPSGIPDVRSGDPIAAVYSGIELIARHGRWQGRGSVVNVEKACLARHFAAFSRLNALPKA
jgi:hypothetical protein